ncbi:hypothetical protein D3C76_1841960 [compost metagenome]
MEIVLPTIPDLDVLLVLICQPSANVEVEVGWQTQGIGDLVLGEPALVHNPDVDQPADAVIDEGLHGT